MTPGLARSSPSGGGGRRDCGRDARREDAALLSEDPPPVAENGAPDQPAGSLQAESRHSAESLKARLFARCERATAGDAALSPPAVAESSLIADVADYLRRHPGAEDSLEGVDRWKEYEGMTGLDARGEAVEIERIVIQGEGWTQDEGATDSSGSSEEAAGENGSDDPDRG